MGLEEIARRVGADLGLPRKLVLNTYKAYWKVIKQHLESLPLKGEITKEELESLQTSVNLPSLGKLYVDKDTFFLHKERYKSYIDGNKYKEDSAS